MVWIRCAAVLLLAACSHMPQSAAYRQESEYTRQGEAVFQNGEYLLAVEYFNSALQAGHSIEDLEGVAISRLNLLRTYQAMGDMVYAHRYADSVLNETALSYPEKYRALAAMQKSLLLVQVGDWEMAADWIEKAAVYCGIKCEYSVVMFNTRALIALGQKDAINAVLFAESALKENRGYSDVELANSLRLLGRAKMLTNDYPGAIGMLEQALHKDKQLGLPDKIVMDMNALAKAHKQQGDGDKSREYEERARWVSECAIKNP